MEQAASVPLHILTDQGSHTVIGQAQYEIRGDKYVIVSVFDVAEVLSAQVGGVLGFSVDYYKKLAVDPHTHIPVQHRDGKEPWCNKCGLNEENKSPKSMFDKKENN